MEWRFDCSPNYETVTASDARTLAVSLARG
uniref:Uncharacterized protein n=1 Tax=Anguilla anguilla TaxID=7936 RepID=A0A0E9TYK9_ANGAN